ncbi:MAG: hypothetical protein BWY32_02487 [bacterium ADurb.Bin243]|nr:MAG: hypothetical protein BWY32_02487 [bacterium ADurb.Bin243]
MKLNGKKTAYNKLIKCETPHFKTVIIFLLLPLIFLCAGGPAAASESSSAETQLKFSDDIKEHFFIGGEFFQKKNYAAALIEYNNIRQIDPAYIEGYLFTAKCYFNLKQYLPAAYFAGFTLYMEPQNEEAKALLEEIKSASPGIDFKDDRVSYKFKADDKIERLIFDVYGSSLYLKGVLEQNGGKKDFAAGDSISFPLDLASIEDAGKLKKFDGTTLQYDLEALKDSILTQKESNLKAEDAMGYFDISGEYLKINRTYKAIAAYETACYTDFEFVKKKDPQFISKAEAFVKDLVKKEPKNSEGYFYMAFILFVQENYREALSNFSYASSLGLKSDILKRAFRYSDLCKQYIKALEAKEIEKEAILKASADASMSNKIAEVIKKTNEDEDIKTELSPESRPGSDPAAKGEEEPASELDFNSMTKEQKMYYCYQQRKIIDEGIQKYNENNIVEMNAETFTLQKLREAKYITVDVKCPDGGNYSLNHNGFVQCSAHGL